MRSSAKYEVINIRTTKSVKEALKKAATKAKTTPSNYGHKLLSEALHAN